ncbi:MAG: PHP domain-containing protein [Lachnospiraceae bacterium]|nr:PHP domain-containing protein [Lachnospiraceae bacterium]
MDLCNITKVDFHMHTIASDGTDSPTELLLKVKEAGLDLFAITDHDTSLGCIEMIKTLGCDDPKFVSGIEFSCQDENGKYHILGYNYDLYCDAIQDTINLGHQYRMEKLYARLDFLNKTYGFIFSDEDIENLLKNHNPGKPHIGNMMVKYGFAKSKDEAITQYINNCTYKSQYISPRRAIQAILDSKGIPVLAHPFYGNGEQLIVGKEMEERLNRLIKMGLKGVEAYYSGFSNKLQNQMIVYANKYNLYITAGSDYHGRNKLVQLGDTNLNNIQEGDEAIRRFIQAL